MQKTTYLAGGCFWGMEELFRSLPGVLDSEVGYCGGENANPTYENHPGHAETLKLTYNDENIDFLHLLDFFFRVHDPTTLNQQGNDRGDSYRSTIFYQSEEEREIAQGMIERVNASGRWKNPVVTTLEPFQAFYKAEESHQDYLQKQPDGYTCHYVRFASFLNGAT